MKHTLYYLKKELAKHWHDYTLLVIAGFLFLVTLYNFKGNPQAQFVSSGIFVVFYVLWGIYHHAYEKTLHIKNVLEYLLMGLLFITLLYVVIFP